MIIPISLLPLMPLPSLGTRKSCCFPGALACSPTNWARVLAGNSHSACEACRHPP